MPIVRKIIAIGETSKGITLPKSWLEYSEQESGRKIVAVAVEVDRVLTLEPVFERKKVEAIA